MRPRLTERSDISRLAELDPPPLLGTTLDLEGNGWGERQTFHMNILPFTKSGGGFSSQTLFLKIRAIIYVVYRYAATP